MPVRDTGRMKRTSCISHSLPIALVALMSSWSVAQDSTVESALEKAEVAVVQQLAEPAIGRDLAHWMATPAASPAHAP